MDVSWLGSVEMPRGSAIGPQVAETEIVTCDPSYCNCNEIDRSIGRRVLSPLLLLSTRLHETIQQHNICIAVADCGKNRLAVG
jgi:hypothetical protein